ncbi:hypothetical protein PL9631_120062 [Planktothrix paucivesiculata PCC 9631]|uniref:BanI/HgiCI C-terminal domain-containing protein n=1 Tax=Planktothrix paucivesiculata PCC 9631 TaxID=671071 RepID=A0A7Z9BJP9_9CYAN|nr:hypothetical protein PL9631_120062 [Planktothrix paucivesiculata PCC 9631]
MGMGLSPTTNFFIWANNYDYLLSSSDCTVAFSKEEIQLLANFIRDNS